VKPQRPSLEIMHAPANANLQHTSTTYIHIIWRTLIDIHTTETIFAGKTIVYILNGKCLFVQGVPENDL
jgi:hypothetical protein